jgi:hypothetical protein
VLAHHDKPVGVYVLAVCLLLTCAGYRVFLIWRLCWTLLVGLFRYFLKIREGVFDTEYGEWLGKYL